MSKPNPHGNFGMAKLNLIQAYHFCPLKPYYGLYGLIFSMHEPNLPYKLISCIQCCNSVRVVIASYKFMISTIILSVVSQSCGCNIISHLQLSVVVV